MSFPRYKQYQETGVAGLPPLPSHWRHGLLKRWITVKSGDMISSAEETEEGFPLIGGNGVRAYTTKQNTAANTLVIGRVGAKCGCIHHVMEDFWASEHALRVIEKRELKKRFFFHLLTALDLNRFAIKTAQPLLNTEIVETQWVGIPPLEEQELVGSFLDRETAKIDALIAEQQRLIELLQEKRQAVISHAVTKGLNPNALTKDSGVEWLGEVPEHWEILPMKRLLLKIEQGWSPDCLAKPADDDEWGVVKAGCVNRGTFNPRENKTLPSDLDAPAECEIQVGDLLMSRASGSPELIGSAAFVEETRPKLLLSDKIFRLKTNERVNRRYLAVALASTMLRQQIRQAISGAFGLANNLPQSEIKTFVVALPPRNEQATIEAFITRESARINDLLQGAEETVALLQERRSTLISAAVTGQIDVRGLVTEAVEQ